jgi:hypothetical protein
VFKIIVTSKSFTTGASISPEVRFRSLEHFLNKDKRSYEFDADSSQCSIEVEDKADALLLIQRARLDSVQFVSPDGSKETLYLKVPKSTGRPRNIVFDASIGRGMTLNQYSKHVKDQSMSKSEITKRGILTKAQVEQGIQSGSLQVVSVGTSQRITKDSIQKYLN